MLCLTHATDPRWADLAVADLDRLLADHAHCEMKAASNAISLATRWPASTRIARALVALAEEELQHFRAVLDRLEERGVALGKPEVDDYVAQLRKRADASAHAATNGRRSPEDALVDRLLVGALIEARSCERFRLLADALARRGDALAPFYEDLFACEARHYVTLIELAAEVSGSEDSVRTRLAELAVTEGELAATFGARAAIHG